MISRNVRCGRERTRRGGHAGKRASAGFASARLPQPPRTRSPRAGCRGRRSAAPPAREAPAGRGSSGSRAAEASSAGQRRRTCASVAFWNASKIFFSATVSPVRLSIAFHTMPYACARGRRRPAPQRGPRQGGLDRRAPCGRAPSRTRRAEARTPFPSFCCTSYLRSTCLSISSPPIGSPKRPARAGAGAAGPAQPAARHGAARAAALAALELTRASARRSNASGRRVSYGAVDVMMTRSCVGATQRNTSARLPSSVYCSIEAGYACRARSRTRMQRVLDDLRSRRRHLRHAVRRVRGGHRAAVAGVAAGAAVVAGVANKTAA